MSMFNILFVLSIFLCFDGQSTSSAYASSTASSNEGSASSEASSTSNNDDSGQAENCKPDEVVSECIQNDCRIQSCSQQGVAILCAEPVPENLCTRGCVCPIGTLRNDDGICVPEDQCPDQDIGDETCPENEVISNCIQNSCGQYCSQKGLALPCAAIAEEYCQRGCICQPGFLRTAEGNCISEDRCYGDLVCDENEIANSCPGLCNDYCPTSDDSERSCFSIQQDTSNCGEPTCTCRFNYRRDNDNGTCIPTRECPPYECTGPYEVYNACPPLCPTDDCSQATPDGRCPRIGRIGIVVECEPKCRCANGFWRDNGICVPYLACPGKCPANEEYSSCANALCRAENCAQLGGPVAYATVSECEERCVCIEGTLRNENGECVPESQCPGQLVCGQNEVVNECTNGCDSDACPTIEGIITKKNCIAPAVCGPPACTCQSGYARDNNGDCIPIDNCPAICSPNEEYSNCSNALCRAQNCSQLGQPVACASVSECFDGCVCVEGTLRNENGECVPEGECPDQLLCGENEDVYLCTNGCDSDVCPSIEEAVRQRDCVAPAVCLPPKCMCQPGYGRDDSGACVPLDSCPPVCPSNEELSDCVESTCRPQTCSELNGCICQRVPEENCSIECVCIEGTVRGENGNCIPEEQCGEPSACGENEEINECTNGCDSDACPTIEGIVRQRNCIAPAVCGPPACTCQSGYARDDSGNCIPVDNCPAICPPNEEYSNCSNALCRAQNCAQIGRPVVCSSVSECEDNCVCVQGALRNDNGECVPEGECPEQLVCGDNEQVNECTNGCDSDVCPTLEEIARRKDCIAPAVCGPPACTCQPGYARDADGNCIPIDSCPPICPADEEFTECVESICRPQNCSQIDDCTFCSPAPDENCSFGCVCPEGYVRGDGGICIPEDQCGSKN